MTDFTEHNITHHTITTPRLKLHYRQQGPKDGIPMLFLHGSYATSRWWQPLFNELPEQILTVAPDLRGVGDTEHTPHGYTIPEQAEDIAGLIRHLNWLDFDIVAHSSGGAIAMEYILNNPEMVRTLTLVDSVPLEGIFTPVETYVLLDQMRTDQALLAQALQTLMPTLDLSGANQDALAFFEQLVADAQAMAPAAFTALADALNHWNRFGDGQHLRLPTLLLWGDQDIIIDRDSITRTLLAIPGANNLEVLRSVGHSPMIEAPLILAERLIDFITDDFSEFEAVRQIATEEATAEITDDSDGVSQDADSKGETD